MKPISPRIHGMLDYVTVALLVLAPTLFGFDGVPAKFAFALAGVHLLLTALTAMPLGLIKLIPFRVHGVIEVIVGFVLIALPWVLGFAQMNPARNFFLALAIVILVVSMLTDFRAQVTGGNAT